MKRLPLLLLGCLCALTARAQTVLQNVTYTATASAAGPSTIDANTNVTVASGATVTYTASTSVRLGPGFTAASGSAFHAQIGSGGGTDQTVAISPTSQTIAPGASVTFTASGGHNGYVWGGSASGTGTSQTVTFSTSGTYGVTVYSSSGSGYNQSNSALATITVNTSSLIPTITSGSSAHGTVTIPFGYITVATNSPTGFSAPGLPTGLGINPSTGVISGTPASGTAGTYVVSLSATNAYGTGTLSLTLTIADGTSDTSNVNELNIHHPL